jgi:hypothetical protein
VLCYIERLPHEAVARLPGWPLGTVRGRIARGRDLLAARLFRRGLAPAAVQWALGLLPKTAGAMPVRLVEATVRATASESEGVGRDRTDGDWHSTPLSVTTYILRGDASSSTAHGSPRENRTNREPGLRD